MKTKQIEWSYPTSTNACRFGFGKTGCYTVQTSEGIKEPEALKGFKEFEAAKEYADALPFAWNSQTHKPE